MDRLSLVGTSEMKYTDQYCYNKEMKTRALTSGQFYLITKDDTVAREYNCMANVQIYQTIFQST